MRYPLHDKLTIALALIAVLVLAWPAAAGMKTFSNPTPAFSISYPDTFVERPLRPKEVLHVANPWGLPSLTVALSTPAKGQTLEQSLKNYVTIIGKHGTDVQLLNSEKVKLGNVEAIKSVIRWKYGGAMDLMTMLTVFIKDGKVVMIGCHTDGSPKKMQAIQDTIKVQ